MKFKALVFAIGCCSLATASAGDDLRTKDLAGVRLGMSKSEVADVFKQIEATHPKCSRQNWPGGKAYPQIGEVQAINCEGDESQYNVQAYMSVVSGRVAHIHFINYDPRKRLEVAKFIAQLQAKYGPATFKESDESRSWYTDDNGQPYALNAKGYFHQCVGLQAYYGNKADEKCNVVLSASASTDDKAKRGSRPVTGYTIVMSDHRLLTEARRK